MARRPRGHFRQPPWALALSVRGYQCLYCKIERGASSHPIIMHSALRRSLVQIPTDRLDCFNTYYSNIIFLRLQTLNDERSSCILWAIQVNESVAASKKALATLWKFSRPHTIIGTITSVVALHMMMIPSNVGMLFALSPLFLKVVAPTLISALLLNVYIVGLNQVTDVSIDKVNKPNLPLASGAMSMKQAIGVILTSLIAGLLIGFLPGVTTAPLQFTLVASGLLGTLYSLPPFRFKRFPTSAALCIRWVGMGSAVRGFVINWGFAAHAFIKLSSDVATSVPIPDLPLKVTLIAAFYTVYGVVIALAKDVPDVKGDEGHGIRSFSVRLGQDKVLALAQWLLSSVHLAAAGVLLFGGGGGMATSNGRFLAAGLAVLAAESIRRERQDVDAKKPEDSYKTLKYVHKMTFLKTKMKKMECHCEKVITRSYMISFLCLRSREPLSRIFKSRKQASV
eukprot:jgi/Bigna1/75563/fgenesh1_pg.35_\